MRLVNPGVQDGSITPAKLSFLLSFIRLSQSADLPSTPWFTPAVTGNYIVWARAYLIQVATTSSTLPQPRITYTEDETGTVGVVQSFGNTTTGNILDLSSESQNTGSFGFTAQMLRMRAGQAVNCLTAGYASVGAQVMLYNLRYFAMGPF